MIAGAGPGTEIPARAAAASPSYAHGGRRRWGGVDPAATGATGADDGRLAVPRRHRRRRAAIRTVADRHDEGANAYVYCISEMNPVRGT